MYVATKDIILPTTITGSLPRPTWYTENLGKRHFLKAMVTRRFREQYEDALTCYLRDQELAGLDIVTDGDCRFDDDVGGQSWTAYPPNRMTGLAGPHAHARAHPHHAVHAQTRPVLGVRHEGIGANAERQGQRRDAGHFGSGFHR